MSRKRFSLIVEEDKKSLILSMGRTKLSTAYQCPQLLTRASPCGALSSGVWVHGKPGPQMRHRLLPKIVAAESIRHVELGDLPQSRSLLAKNVSLRALKPRARSRNLLSRIWFRIAMIGSANYYPGRSDPNRPRGLRRLLAGAMNPQPATFYLGGKSKEVVLIIISKIAFVIEEKHGSISSLQPCALLPCYSFSTGEISPTLVRSEVISGLSRRCPRGRYFSIRQYSPIF